MPTIYLSPSTQPYNLYASGENEQEVMNRLADALEPLLAASGIQFVRKTLDMSAADAIAASNAGDFDLHLALHSNAAPETSSGKLRGILVFYNPANSRSKQAATLLAESLAHVYPYPSLVRIEPTSSIGEVQKTNIPSAFLEIGYHDNLEDAQWLTSHIPEIAQRIDSALDAYFRLPTEKSEPARVEVDWGQLNLRESPNRSARVLAGLSDGTAVEILGRSGDWYKIRVGDLMGYANVNYIHPL